MRQTGDFLSVAETLGPGCTDDKAEVWALVTSHWALVSMALEELVDIPETEFGPEGIEPGAEPAASEGIMHQPTVVKAQG